MSTKKLQILGSLDVPTKTSELENDSGFITSVPVTSVNSKIGDVVLTAADVGADASGTASSIVSTHNSNSTSHVDIREQISQLSSEIADLTLGLHTDGLVYLFKDGVKQGTGIAMVGGETGDVIGNVDSANTIILNGNLSSGDYTVKYEMEDGSLVDIGALTIASSGTDEPTSRLPAEYQEVEWVQIVNEENVEVTSAVHTDIKWSDATKIKTKIQNITSSNTNDIIFCAWSSATTKATPYIATRTSKASNMYGYTSGLTGYSVSPNNIAATDTNVNEFEFNFTHTATTDICFGGWYDATFTHPHKWYYVEIYNGDTLFGNFIPCYRKADNVNGFYDLVSGAFYTDSGVSASGVAFTFKNRGNDVTNSGTTGGSTEPDTPDIPVETNYFNPQTATLNSRLGSSGTPSTYNGMVTTDFIPWEDGMSGKMFKFSGAEYALSAAYSYWARAVFYDSDKTKVAESNDTGEYDGSMPTTVGAYTGGGFVRLSIVVKDNVAITNSDVASLKITLE